MKLHKMQLQDHNNITASRNVIMTIDPTKPMINVIKRATFNSTQLKFIENGSRMAKGIQYIKTT